MAEVGHVLVGVALDLLDQELLEQLLLGLLHRELLEEAGELDEDRLDLLLEGAPGVDPGDGGLSGEEGAALTDGVELQRLVGRVAIEEDLRVLGGLERGVVAQQPGDPATDDQVVQR